MDNDFDNNDFEEWEGDYQLIQEEDWAGLVKLRKQRAEKHPADLYAQFGYAEALSLNREFENALNFLKPFYAKYPDIPTVVHSILDALYGLGKTEHDYDWIEKPIILKLDDQTIKLCEDFLKDKRRAIDFSKLTEHFIIQSYYLTFEEEDLLAFLKLDGRFEFTDDKEYWEVRVKLSKRK